MAKDHEIVACRQCGRQTGRVVDGEYRPAPTADAIDRCGKCSVSVQLDDPLDY